MSKHTAGPWTLNGCEVEKDRKCIAAVRLAGGDQFDETNDNALLIAAAPSMDIALRSIAVNLALFEKSGDHGYLTLAREAADNAIKEIEP